MIVTGERYKGIGDAERAELVGYYNTNCIGLVKPSRRYTMTLDDEWCAMFLSVIAHKSGLRSGQFPFEVSVYYMCELAKEWGIYSEDSSSGHVGDLVVYDWNGNGGYDHVGIISDATREYLQVLEGNYKGTVGNRFIPRSSPLIKGMINIGQENERIKRLVVETLNGKHGNGEERKKSLGKSYGQVQHIINQLYNR